MKYGWLLAPVAELRVSGQGVSSFSLANPSVSELEGKTNSKGDRFPAEYQGNKLAGQRFIGGVASMLQ